MVAENLSRITRHRIDELCKNATLYRITLDELKAYDSFLYRDHKSKNRERIDVARENGQDHFLMVMMCEGLPEEDGNYLIRLTDVIRGRDEPNIHDRRTGLQKKGYMLITEPDVIAKIEKDFPEKIRSFKEDLFPDGPVKMRRRFDTSYENILKDYETRIRPNNRR